MNPPSEPVVLKETMKGGRWAFVDVGANVGEYSVRLWRRYDTIVALEPNGGAFDTLRFNFGWRCLLTRFLPVKCAASDTDGKTYLFLDRDGKRCSGSGDTIETIFNYRPASISDMELITHHAPGDGGARELVDCRRLDTLLPYLGLKMISMMKIDVEGAEFKVLAGARSVLQCTRRVVVELHDRMRQHELRRWLSEEGFDCRWLDADHILGER